MSDVTTPRVSVTLDFELPSGMTPHQCVEFLRLKAKEPFTGVRVAKAFVHEAGAIKQDVI